MITAAKLIDGYYYYNVMLNINTVKELANKLYSLENAEIDAIQGKYIIDAKSIMGIFSLGLTKPITIRIYKSDFIEAQLHALENILRPCLI